MKDKIISYLAQYMTINADLEQALKENTFIQSYKKDTLLLAEGEYSRECYFVLQGCIRNYRLKEGDDMTLEFYTEYDTVIPIQYNSSIPSDSYFQCTEDTIVSLGNPQLEKEMFQKYPELEKVSLLLAEKAIAKQKTSLADYKSLSPQERYKELRKTRPALIQRVPQYQIASYLGIQPESLSRIRKRMVTSNRRS